ncbi:EamA family transporter [Pedobacter petrophilus]|uniref:EamA family transporter n=2 Tax=Pedobacter TaxID=84567 RepID=A0A7K0G475_9SPHI|nr:EamA family transporter [Pedobacter petrophilus]MRX78511.1 EamA family transporter [Pedobacter petrophilus]
MKNLNNFKYYLAAIVAFSIWGSFSLVLRPLQSYSSLDILFYRVFSCAVLMSVVSMIWKRKKMKENLERFIGLPVKKRNKILWLNIGASILLTINWFSFIYVMNHINVRATSVAYLICPVLTTVLAYLFLREKLNSSQWFAVLLSFTGCILLSYTSLINMLYSAIVGLSYACYLISQNKNDGFDKFLTLNIHIVLSAISLLPFYPFYSGPLPTQIQFYFYVEIIAILYTIVALFLNLYALSGISSSKVGMILNLNPIIAFILSITLYHESFSLITIIAYSIILMAVVIFNSSNLVQSSKSK